VFRDRRDAGRQLGEWFLLHPPKGDLIVLGLPRGGVPVAYELAQALNAPLDVFLVRKLGAPFNPEYAVGAIAAGGVVVYNDEALAGLALDERDLGEIIAREGAELARRERAYRAERPPPVLDGKTVILVDDGIATGSTMRAAVTAVKALRAQRIIVAAPTASREAIADLERSADLVAALSVPEPYIAVGRWYEHFPQVDDREVVELLAACRQERARQLPRPGRETADPDGSNP
jgi:putative phosphoribosyl transferase